MRIIKLTILVVCLAAFGVETSAQSIVCKKLSAKAESNLGENTASVMFVSPKGDWVIKSLKEEKPLDSRRNPDGAGFVYESLVDVSTYKECTFILGRQGSAITDQCVSKGLRSGMRVIYSIDEEADTLSRIEAQRNNATGVYPDAGKGCVEITTTLNNLNVVTDWPKTEDKSVNGARVIKVVVDVERLGIMRGELDSLSQVMQQMEKDNDYLNMAPLAERLNSVQAQYDRYEEITLGGKGVKPLALSLADLAMKERRRYAVIAITESFEALLAHARALRAAIPQHVDNGHYDATRIAYDKALEHKDAPPADLETIRNERNEVAALRKMIWLMWRAGDMAAEAEKTQGLESEEVYKKLLAKYNIAGKLIKENPQIQGLQAVREETYERLKKHPMFYNKTEVVETHHRQVITGKVVAGDNFYMSVPGLRVYSVRYPGKIKSGDAKQEIGRIKPDGTFSIALPEPTSYIYIEGEKMSRHIDSTTSDMGTLVLCR